MRLRSKLWIVTDEGEKLFGDGPYRLLLGVQKTGSLKRAADEQKMAYSKAYMLLKSIEKRLGVKIINFYKGGKNGGGAVVTAEGQKLLKKYEQFSTEARNYLNELFKKYFEGGK
ncbi:winged helix-turn-helix domain-containing protein [Carboxydothermus pertinax]|uniref:Molybdenum transporter n=1 Tax=Carboxydothermus pertinax TaxID=870242 RepID=A0A1L8CVU7_9THEO|nr:LysR family transcriptional regulator [Carboxydothermus pertinax]GAV22979.1 molybdenum transporter [Carboxydothermus pertinax]